MTILYMDTSALLKRVVIEAESEAVRALLLDRHASGDLLTASSITWLEMWRSLRRAAVVDVGAAVSAALSGVAQFALAESVLQRARRVGAAELRSFDAIHLASAIAVGADVLVTYDRRLAESAASAGLEVLAPTG